MEMDVTFFSRDSNCVTGLGLYQEETTKIRMRTIDALSDIAEDMHDLAVLKPLNWDALLTRQAIRLLDVVDRMVDDQRQEPVLVKTGQTY